MRQEQFDTPSDTTAGYQSPFFTALGIAESALQARLVATAAVTDTLFSSAGAILKVGERRVPAAVDMLQESALRRSQSAREMAEAMSSRGLRRERSRVEVQVAQQDYEQRREVVSIRPSARRFETDDAEVIELDVPGILESSIKVDVDADSVYVVADRVSSVDLEFDERYEAKARLPEYADTSEVSASLANGILSIVIPKPASAQRRQVKVAVGEPTSVKPRTAAKTDQGDGKSAADKA